ncbi:MAG: barstar family protein [Clostridia bacterium]|nr:barstar family protein [Clostridia bacterium]
MKKNCATLNLSGCQYIDELHDRIEKALCFPEHYGRNLDAFWDCLNSDCEIAFVSIIGSDTVAENLKPTVKIILELFEENKKDWADSDCPFDYEVL